MIFEYALDPALVNTPQALREWNDKFGRERGRLIARYPRNWSELVLAGCRQGGVRPVERLRFVERLKDIDRKMVKRRDSSPWGGGPWTHNAVAEHKRDPFQAVLCRVPEGEFPGVLRGETVLEEGDPLWEVPFGREVVRRPHVIADLLLPMLRISEHVAFIDPYWGFEKRWTALLHALLAKLRTMAVKPIHFEIQTAFKGFGGPPAAQWCQEQAALAFAKALPPSSTLEIYMIEALPGDDDAAGDERPHNRYVLTDVGGVMFGVGLDVGHEPSEGHPGIDDVNRLSEEQYQRRWRRYVLRRRPEGEDRTHTLFARVVGEPAK